MRRLFRHVPDWSRACAAFALGALMATGQAPLGWWFLTLPALAGLCILLRRGGAGRGWWIGHIAGAGYFAAALNWIVEPFLVDPLTYGWMAPFAVVLMSVGLGLFWGGAGALATRVRPGLRPVAFAVALTGMEFLRGHVLTGFPWALVGHVWIGWAPAQLAAWVGPVGLTLMTALAAALPVAFRWRGAAVSALGLALAFAAGMWRLDQPEPASPGPTVRLIQPNAAQAMKWDPERAGMLLQRGLDFSAEAGSPDLIVWPETSIPYLLDDALAAEVARAAQGATSVVGIQRLEGERAFNSLAVIGPDGRVGQVYDKYHLVPFGEYIPFGDTLAKVGIRAFAAQLGNGYTAGSGPELLTLGITRALPLICYEAVFPQDVAAAPERPDWLLQATNDAWFGTLTGPYQHLAQARLRAIEQGLPFLRAANTGVSAVIDARGRIRTSLPMGVAGKLDAPLPAALPPTLYSRAGDVPVLVVLALMAALLATRPCRNERLTPL